MSEVKQRLMLLYGSEGNGPKVQVLMQDDTMWMTQKQMSELFGVDRTVIGKHLKIIFDSEELAQDVVCANFAHMASDSMTTKSWRGKAAFRTKQPFARHTKSTKPLIKLKNSEPISQSL